MTNDIDTAARTLANGLVPGTCHLTSAGTGMGLGTMIAARMRIVRHVSAAAPRAVIIACNRYHAVPTHDVDRELAAVEGWTPPTVRLHLTAHS